MLIFATAKVDSIITKAISKTLFSMEYKGKQTCRILKDIRRQIAEANDIDLVISECTHRGDCLGTCPRCEAEVAYLERELARRQTMGKAVCISGIAASALLGMPAAAQMAADTTNVLPEVEVEAHAAVTKAIFGAAPMPAQQPQRRGGTIGAVSSIHVNPNPMFVIDGVPYDADLIIDGRRAVEGDIDKINLDEQYFRIYEPKDMRRLRLSRYKPVVVVCTTDEERQRLEKDERAYIYAALKKDIE